MRGSESLDMTVELRMPRAPYEKVSARPAQSNKQCLLSRVNSFTYGSNNHAIQWMPEQPNCLKQKEKYVFCLEKNTCAGTVEKWQKEKPYMSQMHVTNPGNETCEGKEKTRTAGRDGVSEEPKNKRRRFVGNLSHPVSGKEERTKATCYCGHQDAIPEKNRIGRVGFTLSYTIT